MARYRIGNDMTVVWSIYDHTGAAYNLNGKEVRLYYTCERGRFEVDFEIQGANNIVWSFLGREQKVIGDYTLSLEILESAGKRRIFKDYCNAFTLVGKSCEEAALGNPNISEDGNIVLSSKLDVYKIQPIIPTVGSNSNWFVDGTDTGKPSTGKSAYEYAKEKGYEGTESEYAESLKLAPENAEKLTELSGELANTLVELKGDGSFDINGKAGVWVYYNLPPFKKGGKYSISLQLYDAINDDLYWYVVADNDKIIIDTRQVAPNVLISNALYEADEDYENVRIGVYSSASSRMRLMMSSNVYAVSALQPIQDIVGYKSIDVTWNTGWFISLDGYVMEGAGYKFSHPIHLKKGDTIKYSTKSYQISAISLTDANSSYIKPIVKVETGDVYAYQSFFYTAEEDCYIILSGLEPQLLYVDNSSIFLQKCDSLNKTLGESINSVESEVSTLRDGIPFFRTPYQILRNTAVGASPYGSLVSVSMYDSLVATAKGKKVNILFPLDYSGGYALYSGKPSSDTIIGRYVEHSASKEWEIELSDDVQEVVLCIYKNEGTEIDFANTSCVVTNFDAEAGNDNSSQNYCGINIVEPFRILTGKTEWLYKDSLLAAFSPLTNFSITTDVDGSNKEFIDYSSKAFRLNKTSEGVFPLVVKATDGTLRTTQKQFNVIARNAPSKKLTNKDKLRVLFVGDSLIFANYNLMGREWLRMLNTSDTSTRENEDGSIELPTLNLTDGKIQLYGEQRIYEEAPYTMAAAAHIICEATDSSNPFYNPSSSQPNELGEDGINKRVDFGWWFDKVIGKGENPDLIYLATGPNDFVTYGWFDVGIEPTVKRVVAICKKIKSVCDSRAGGNSGLVIKVVQHQPYPVQGNPVYNFPPLQQRVLWQKTIVRYAEEFINQGMSSYAEVVPCASRFDVGVGYTLTSQRNNARYNGISDELYTPEAIHMNSIGAYNYADALITDFIADERFD